MKKIITCGAIALMGFMGTANADLTTYTGTAVNDSEVFRQNFTLLNDAASLTLSTTSWASPSDADPYLTLFYGDGHQSAGNADGDLIAENDDINFPVDFNAFVTIDNLVKGNYFYTVSFNGNYIAENIEPDGFQTHWTNWDLDSWHPASPTRTFADLNMNGNWSVSLDVLTAVPVPASVWLFGSALAGFMGISRRRNDILQA